MDQVPSLFELSLVPLSVQETLEICNSGRFPPCQGVWKRKAEVNLGIPPNFFDLYLGGPTSTFRPISEPSRYLELLAINDFSPEMAVYVVKKTGEISGLIESFAGVQDAVYKNNSEQFDFFFARLKPWLRNSIFEYVETLGFPIQEDFSLKFFQQVLEKVSSPYYGSNPAIHGARIFLKEHFLIPRENIEITDSPALFLSELDRLLPLIEKGNLKTLQDTLTPQRKKSQNSLVEIFNSVLKSGQPDLLQFFSPYVVKVIPTSSGFSPQLQRLFVSAAKGGNPAFIEMLQKISGYDPYVMESAFPEFYQNFCGTLIQGFFAHRNVIWTRQLFENMISPSLLSFYDSSWKGIPVDILDSVISKSEDFVRRRFLVDMMLDNLGYINVILYCLNQLSLLPQEYKKIDTIDQIEFRKIKGNGSMLAPLSTSLIKSSISSWTDYDKIY
nr:hypothetical protein pmam_299 [Pithovirus mammoth]